MLSEGIDVVLDVGASAGHYGEGLRRAGYQGQIVSVEPLPDAYANLEHRAASDPAWESIQLALGESDGLAEINIAGNSWSSSLLPMGARHLRSAPESAYIGRVSVRTARLDSVWNEVAPIGSRPWLKLDVQGYEMHVLRGAGDRLDDVHAVQTELELVSLYEGDPHWRVVLDFLEGHGFTLVGLEPGFEDPASGRMLQFDGIFVRG